MKDKDIIERAKLVDVKYTSEKEKILRDLNLRRKRIYKECKDLEKNLEMKKKRLSEINSMICKIEGHSFIREEYDEYFECTCSICGKSYIENKELSKKLIR